MKLSEAILLGSTLMPWACGIFQTPDGSGCALGMAMRAGGCGNRYELHDRWPVLRRAARAPCDCYWAGTEWVFDTIIHLNDIHIHAGDWTLEKIAAWVAEQEAACEHVPEREAEAALPAEESVCS